MYGAAASRDFFNMGLLHFGDVIYIEGYGYRVINDVMGPRATHSIDILVFTYDAERKIGVRHKNVWLIRLPAKTKIAEEMK